jgi:hypothetical protein
MATRPDLDAAARQGIRNDKAIHAVERCEQPMMRTVAGRIDRLENRLGIAAGKPKLRVIICRAGWGEALSLDRCSEILSECGFLPDGISVVDLLHIPEDLNAEELERYLRENGAEICGPRGAQSQNGATGLNRDGTAK